MAKSNIKKIIILIVIILLIAIILTVLIKKETSDNNKIKGSGTIEVVEINVSSKIMGRIKDFSTDEGEKVIKNQILAKIESEEVGAKFDEANAAYSQAIEQLQRTKAILTNSEKDLMRFRELYNSGSIARMQLDNIETKYRTDIANFRSALAGVERAKSGLSLAKHFSKEYIITSPADATVLKKYFEQGELVMPGSVLLSLGDLKNVYLRIYIPVYKLGMIKPGQKVKVKTDTYKNKIYYGKITQISQKAEFTPKNIQTEEERVRLVFGVKISIQNDNLELKPGMPADAEIIIE